MTGDFKTKTEMRTTGDSGESAVAVVRVDGEIDMATAQALADALGADQVRDAAGVILDLSQVPFMDSTGLRTILVSSEEIEGRLATVVPSGSAVARLIEMTEVGERLESHPDEDTALAAIGSPR